MNYQIIVIISIAFIILVSAILLIKISKPLNDPKRMNKMLKDVIKTEKNILDNNEEDLKEIVRRSADIESEGLKIKAKAIQEGLSSNSIQCKYCGSLIDNDSTFCKKCGKSQEK